MSNKFNLFGGSVSSKAKAGKSGRIEQQSDSGAAAATEQQQVTLDAWIETKVVSVCLCFGPLINLIRLKPTCATPNDDRPLIGLESCSACVFYVIIGRP